MKVHFFSEMCKIAHHEFIFFQITEKLLKESEGLIRTKLSESLGNSNIPRLNFVAEQRHLLEQVIMALAGTVFQI